MLRYAAIIAAMLLVLGCIGPAQPSANATQQVISAPNGTGLKMTPIGNAMADIGDTVWADYTLTVDGKVLDTTNATLANLSGIYNPGRTYEPLQFEVGFNKGIIAGFVQAVIGTRVGETVSFDVEPDLGYGMPDPAKIVVVQRYYNRSIIEVVPRKELEEKGINITKGEGFDTAFGTVFIQDFNETSVTLAYVLVVGSEFTVSGIPQRVAGVNNYTAFIEYALDENMTYRLPDPRTGAPTVFRITNKTDANITLDANHPLAGKRLHFNMTLVRAERPA